MNNLEKITGRIIDEALAEADSIIAAAVESAAQITEDGEHRINDAVKMAQKTAEKETLSTIERAYSTADMKKREILLGTKVGLIAKAYRLAEEKILNLDDREYCIFAGHLLCDAVADRVATVEKLRAEYGDEEEYSLDFEAVFNAKDKELRAPVIVKTAKMFLKKISTELGKTEISVSSDTADISGGLILRCGDIEINCSVEAVIADIREETEPDVARILFTQNSEGNTNDT